MDFIVANPDLHDQSEWSTDNVGCGTTRCFAGWGLHQAGLTFTEFDKEADRHFEYVDNRKLRERFGLEVTRGYPRVGHWDEAGRALFGLTKQESYPLFRTARDVMDLYRMLNWMSDGAIEIPRLDLDFEPGWLTEGEAWDVWDATR